MATSRRKNLEKPQEAIANLALPLMSGEEELNEVSASSSSRTITRRNRSATITRTDQYANIDSGLTPFRKNAGSSNVDIKDAVELCQKAYYNFAVFRSTIDLMTEFSVGEVELKNGSKKSRNFFNALFKKVNIWNFQDQFFREYFRSGNVFIHRFDYILDRQTAKKMTNNMNLSANILKDKVHLPSKYTILDPADIQAQGNVSFLNGVYFKTLNAYEVARLRAKKTEQERLVYESLPDATQKQIDKKNASEIVIILDPEKTSAVFYKKQDYEPFAAPLGFPVLEDLNYKKELRKMDMAISRTMQQAVLLVTTGAKPDDGGVNPKSLAALQKLFQNESVGRVLIADYTTEAKFVIPEIADILDPKKYEILDRDIREGLGNILLNEEKFSNAKIKLHVFAQKLNEARKAFIKDFLEPEMKRIGKEMGLRSVPTPFIQDVDLENKVILGRIYTRLIELGVLTPDEGLRAIETGRLPTKEESIEAQREFKLLRDNEELYQPLIQKGQKEQKKTDDSAGRPGGSGGESQIETTRGNGDEPRVFFSIKKFVEAQNKYFDLEKLTKKCLRAKYGRKTKLTKMQTELAENLTEMVARNAKPSEWNEVVVKDFLENPTDRKDMEPIEDIGEEHGVDLATAALLYHSKA